MTECAHMEFQADCRVARLEDSGEFRIDIQVHCSKCGERFRFLGAPTAIMAPKPCTSIDGCELSCPIEPEGAPRLASHSTIYMPKLPERV